jgi:hypothetical protein
MAPHLPNLLGSIIVFLIMLKFIMESGYVLVHLSLRAKHGNL